MAKRTNIQDIKLIPRLGEVMNKIVNGDNQGTKIAQVKPTQAPQVVPATRYVQRTITQSKPILPPPSSLDIVVNSIKLIDDIHPTLCNDLKHHLFPEDVTSGTLTDGTTLQDAEKIDIRASMIDVIAQQSVDYSKYFEEYVRNIRIEKFANLLNISRSADKLKKLFLNGRGQIPHLYEQDVDVTNNYDITKKENIDTIISISRQNFVNLVLETYPDDDAIVKQFLLDLPRQDVYLNGHKIKTIDNLFMGLSMHNKLIYLDQATPKSRPHISTMMMALLLICQSSFFVSFLHLHNKVGKMKSILDGDVQYKNDQRHNVHVADLKERDRIDISVTAETFSCSFGASYRILDITEDRTLFKVQTETLFDINSDTCLIVYEAIQSQ